MKILHMVPALELGGVEKGTIDLALSLTKLGHAITVISNGGRLVKDLERNGVTHLKLPIHKKSLLTLLLVPEVMRILKRHQIDIVHASSRLPAWVGFFACRLTGTPFVTSCHGFYSRHFPSRVMGWGKLVMVISKSIEERMVNAFGVRRDKIRLVYRGLDLSKYPYDPDKYNEKKDSFVVLNIGRLTSIKGQYEFIETMKSVRERVNAEAWIVGGAVAGKEYYSAKLKVLIKRLGLEKHVKLLGLRDDTPDLLRKADCLVLSSNVPEGFGRTVIEAGATGTAVCASDLGGVKEIIDDGISGLLFPLKDSVAMANTIVRMLGDAGLRRKCASNLRKKVEESFTLSKMTRDTLAVYEEALGLTKK